MPTQSNPSLNDGVRVGPPGVGIDGSVGGLVPGTPSGVGGVGSSRLNGGMGAVQSALPEVENLASLAGKVG